MNHIYRIIWNSKVQQYIVCSELAHKTKGSVKNATSSIALLLAIFTSVNYAEAQPEFIFDSSNNDNFFDLNNWGDMSSQNSNYDFNDYGWDLNNDAILTIKSGDTAIMSSLNNGEQTALSNATLKIDENATLSIKAPYLSHLHSNPSDGLKIISQGHILIENIEACDNPYGSCDLFKISNLKLGSHNPTQAATLKIVSTPFNSDVETMAWMDYGTKINALSVGTQDTYGEVIIDGGLLQINSDQQNMTESSLLLGSDDGYGKISILNGGKLGAAFGGEARLDFVDFKQSETLNYNNILDLLNSPSPTGEERNFLTLGQNGGHGEIFISGKSNTNQSLSLATIGQHTILGSGEDSIGKISLTDGGQLQVFSSIETQYILSDLLTYGYTQAQVDRISAASILKMGVNDGHGEISINGKESFAQFGGYNNVTQEAENIIHDPSLIGELTIGNSGTGTITLNDEGRLGIGYIHQIQDYAFYTFSPGILNIDPNDPLSLKPHIFYGKTILATGEDSAGIINFTGKTRAKASEQLLTSNISVGRGQGMINLNHTATESDPFIFDLQLSEAYDPLYHADLSTIDSTFTPQPVGQIDFNQLGGVTLLKPHECRAYNCSTEPTITFDYSGDTNILGGILQVEDANLLSQSSHFNIGTQGNLEILNADQTIKSLHNDGLLSIGNKTNTHIFGNQLTINGNYSGQGSIILNSRWATDQHIISTDSIHIKGNVLNGTHTEIIVRNNIVAGDIIVKNNASQAIITVDGTASQNSFYGTANTENAGYQAKISYSIDKNGLYNFFWSTTVKPINNGGGNEGGNGNISPSILEENVSLMTQMTHANQRQILSTIGRYAERKGSIDNGPYWIHQYGQHSSLSGDNRFSYDSKLWSIQLGFDLYKNQVNGIKHTAGLFLGYGSNNLKFKDQYRTQFGSTAISDDKYTGSGETSMYSLGAYYTLATEQEAYIDVLAMLSQVDNKYQPRDQLAYKQKGYAMALSLEAGYPIHIPNSQWKIIPQGQLVYQYLHLRDKAINKHILYGANDSYAIARLGAQAHYQLSQNAYFYADINLLQQLTQNKSTQYGNSFFTEKYSKSWMEFNIGGEYQAGKDITLFGNVSYQHNINRPKYRAYKGNIGLTIRF